MITLINSGPGTGKTFTLNHGYRIISNQTFGRLEPTEEQQAVFDHLRTDYSNPKSVCFFAHNNSTKEALEQRLPKGTKVQTFHGAGQSALIRARRYQRLVWDRSEKHISDITGKFIRDMDQSEKFFWLGIKKLVHYLKLENAEPSQENFDYIRLKYPDMSVYQFPLDWQDRASKLLDLSSVINGTVEFVDMLWLGMRSVRTPVFQLGFVDESQDISNCAFHLVTRLCENVIFCGDRNQAINAFAGASEEMYDSIEKVSDAVLPLKMTLRCPPFICDMANHIRPRGIIKGPITEDGTHETISYDSLPEKIRAVSTRKCLIISRTNAAVISCAIMLHQKAIKCQIIDKDLADEVKKFFGQFQTQNTSKLMEKINAYEDKGRRSRNELWAQMVVDKCTYARELLSAVSSWSELLDLIKETFESYPDGYKLCTIHKSKGLESENIFILNPPVELEVAMKHPIAREQEINLSFVAITRCAKNLFWVVK